MKTPHSEKGNVVVVVRKPGQSVMVVGGRGAICDNDNLAGRRHPDRVATDA